jgi:flagellar motility protein MotE (MotC chaperone)
MKNNGYDQFFKNARKAATHGEVTKPSRQFSTSNVHFELSEEDIEKQLKLRMGMKSKPKKKKKTIPWKLMGVSFLGLLATAWGFQNFEQVEKYVKRIEISFLGSAMAEEAPAKKAAPAAKDVAAAKPEEAAKEEKKAALTDDEIDLKDLEDVRRGISSVLEEKVKGDDKKIDTLVQMYSDMKPPQAAKVFETMDEDLAVDILGRMKKKNAADIMNLLKSEKAQVLSEKFAGYKRKSN